MSPTKTTRVTLPNGDVVPVVSVEYGQESAEVKRLRASAAKAGAKAAAQTLAEGIPITVMRDGVLIQINPDHTETAVEALR